MLVRPQGLLGTVEWGFFKAEGLGGKVKATLAAGLKPKSRKAVK